MNAKRIISTVVESGEVTRIPMSAVIREYSPGEHRHWFDKDTLGYFDTKLGQAYRGPEGIYFVATHKRHQDLETRTVKVHYLSPQSSQQRYIVGTALTMDETPENVVRAQEVAMELASGYPTDIGQDAIDLEGDLMDMGGGEDKIRLVWNSLNKEDFVRKSAEYSHFATATPRNPIYRQARVLGHLFNVLKKYGITQKKLPNDVLTDIYQHVVSEYGDTKQAASPDVEFAGGSLEHFLAYARYMARDEY